MMDKETFELKQEWARANLNKHLDSLEKYKQKLLYYQMLIGITEEEIYRYKEILKEKFEAQFKNITSYRKEKKCILKI